MSKRSASTVDAEDSVPAKRNRVALACVICRQRKIKCDGRKPCKTCTDAKRPALCEYQSTAPLRDDDYVRSLEEQLRLLSSQLTREAVGTAPEQSTSGVVQASDNCEVNPSSFACSTTLSKGSLVRTQSPSVALAQITEYTAPPPQGLASRATASLDHRSSRSESPTACESHYLTTLASPSTVSRNLDSGDSSARTLLHGVEAALQQLPKQAGISTHPPRPVRLPPTSPRYRPAQLPFAWNEGKAELYTLPQRHISDALVNVYRALNYPIFKVLHWPTFMLKYEATFTTAAQADPLWLGILNQVYAIACQIGGREIVGDDEFAAGHKFHQRALALGYPLALCTESLQGLQYLLLMGQYLLSTSQPTLCRNVVGHAVRSAQAQGLHVHRHAAETTTVQTELQRRAMAGVIILDATASAVLGLPPLLSPEGLPYALPNGCEDDSVPADSVDPPPIPQNSSSLFMRETTKLLAIQIQVLTSLYSSAATATSQWPDVNSILLNARQLDRWQSALPPILNYSQDGAEARAGNDELNLQAHVLHARFLNLKLLVHRPMIFHICQKASSSDLLSDAPSHLDADIARSSMSHCCSAALLLIEHVTDSWDHGRRVGGAWWFHLYYFHSACLVIIAGLIVEVIASAKSISCLPDIARAIKALKSARTYLSADPSQHKSILPRLPSGPARSTARSCCRIITGLTTHVLASAPHLDSPAAFEPDVHQEHTRQQYSDVRLSDRWDASTQQTHDLSASDTADLYQTFLNLFPDVPTLPSLETSQNSFNTQGSLPFSEASGAVVDSGFMSQSSWETAPLSAWSIGDLLRAGSASQPLSNFDSLYPSAGGVFGASLSQNDLGFLSSFAGS